MFKVQSTDEASKSKNIQIRQTFLRLKLVKNAGKNAINRPLGAVDGAKAEEWTSNGPGIITLLLNGIPVCVSHDLFLISKKNPIKIFSSQHHC